MAITTPSKRIQLDLFINDQKELENKAKEESLRSMKAQIRLLLHTSHELQTRVNKMEELLGSALDFMLGKEEKTP